MAEGRILVIDDELVMCEFLRDLLQDRGHVVEYATSGNEGVAAFNKSGFNAVMCDLKLPDKYGIDVLREIKQADPDSVVIVMTGYPSFESVQLALREGAHDYVTKPFNIEEISFIIKRAIDFHNLVLTNKRLMKELELQNIKLEDLVKERTKELTVLYRIGRDMSSTLKLDEVLKIIVNRISEKLGAEICSILLLDKNTQELSISSAYGLDEEIIRSSKLKLGEQISGWVVKNRQALLVEDIEKDPRFARENKEKYYTHSFISVPIIAKGEVIGLINVNNKKSRDVFTKDDLRFVRGVANEAAIAIENAGLYTSLEDSYIRTVLALTSAIDAKDNYTKRHSENVSRYAVAIAKEMGLSQKEIDEISDACCLHDLGKIGVPDSILVKVGKLSHEEWEQMKLHSTKGADILRPLTFLSGVIGIIEQHHERYDGQGYPAGLKGEQISLGARILNVADSFDAMTTERPYHRALTYGEALDEIKKCSGAQFDSRVIEAFLRVLEKNPDMFNALHKS